MVDIVGVGEVELMVNDNFVVKMSVVFVNIEIGDDVVDVEAIRAERAAKLDLETVKTVVVERFSEFNRTLVEKADMLSSVAVGLTEMDIMADESALHGDRLTSLKHF